tara:strand:+ start:9515 stop:9679 length:165 start_codon:yes stop_codon:yes gene_type:complete
MDDNEYHFTYEIFNALKNYFANVICRLQIDELGHMKDLLEHIKFMVTNREMELK